MMDGLFDSDSGDSDEEFNGFDYYDIIRDEHERQTRNDGGVNSDIDFSDSDDDDDVNNGAGPNLNLLWNYTDFIEADPDKCTATNIGPTVVLADYDAGPIDYFKLLIPNHFFTLMATQSNLYATQVQESEGKVDPHWEKTNAEEMKAFIGINIVMALNWQPTIASYWAAGRFMGNQGIKDTMTKNRFEKLVQYMHISDNSKAPREILRTMMRCSKSVP
jgi:hypothetical protein